MDPLQLLTASRVAIVAGKGGVGKTTVTAVIARAAAESGMRVLVVDLDGRQGLGELLAEAGSPLSKGALPYTESLLADGLGDTGSGVVVGRGLAATDALVEYLDEHGMRRVSKRLASSGVIDVVSTAVPGIDDLLVLGKIKQLERAAAADLIVVDGPAAGHAITFLLAAAGLGDAVRAGPISAQARDVLEMLGDHARCQVVLVTIPEETPVNETIETAFALEDRVGVQLGPVILNAYDQAGCLVPDVGRTAGSLADAARFRRRRAVEQRNQAERLAAALPLPQIPLPFVFAAGVGAGDVDGLVRALLHD
jgi:anion-transporting  ArsA/GET3 family ATPase